MEELGLAHTETRRGMWGTTWMRRGVGSNDRKTTPATTSTTPSAPTTGLGQCGNDTTRNTGRSGRQNAVTRRSTRRDEGVIVRAPIKKPQPDGLSHMGAGGNKGERAGRGTPHHDCRHDLTRKARLRFSCDAERVFPRDMYHRMISVLQGIIQTYICWDKSPRPPTPPPPFGPCCVRAGRYGPRSREPLRRGCSGTGTRPPPPC